MSTRWYVVQGKRGHEVTAWYYLGSRGIEAYVPLDMRKRHVRGHFMDVQEPRFNGYFFAAFDRDEEDWRRIFRTPEATRCGIVRLLGNDPEKPPPVPDGVMDAIRAYAPPSQLSYEPHRFSPGEHCTMMLHGQRKTAVFVEYLGSRQFVRTWIFGAERVCEVTASEIEPLDNPASYAPLLVKS